MKNRFAKRKFDFAVFRSLFLPVLLFFAVVGLFGWGLNGLTQTTQEEQLKSVEDAITRAVVQCYAVEGQYPPSIDYLREHYGLAVDTERYIVDYHAFASNIMPTVLVLPKDFGGNSASGGLPPEIESLWGAANE